MVYLDHLTKFVQLRPLKTKRAEEVAYHVLPIFLTFGAPAILQSDNGREFSNQVISEICSMLKDVKIVHGKPRHSQTQGSVERANQDIQNMLNAWMNDNNTNKWSEDLSFVQFAKNTTYHEGIRQSLYEAMFGIKAKRGIESYFLPSEQIASIETEEQLEEIANTFETEEQLGKTGNTSEKNLSGGQTENQIPKKNIEEDLQSTTSLHQVLNEKHELISIKRAAAKENLLLQATKMLRTSQNHIISSKFVKKSSFP
ncbi:KRAB-A domain-containing protein 2-like [Argiope bruennichi]|uniref:KRAB-A domain-containing protein 2-like n=1 Tax=Argiope bruennichi TaxID=94029 RepID=UPI0024952F6D|nr:KRAB-A domain-containing protein 2-like [Argiope bruennichi]